MKRLSLLISLLCLCAPAPCETPADRDALVAELLKRSHLLGDARFQVPLAVWKQYVREGDGPLPQGRPAPVNAIAGKGMYRLTISEGGRATLAVELEVHVFHPAACQNMPVLSDKWAWRKVAVNGVEAELPIQKGFLRFTPAAPGRYVVTAEAPLPGGGTEGGSLRLDIPPTVQTLVRVDSPRGWEVRLDGSDAPLIGTAEGTAGELAVTPRSQLSLTWQRPQPVSRRPARFVIGGHVAWDFAADGQEVAARLDLRIAGGATDRIALSLPDGAEAVKVAGADVREAQTARTNVTVFLRGEVSGQTRLDVSFRLPAADRQRISAVTVADGHWASGTLVVTNSAGGKEVLGEEAIGLTDMPISQVPPEAAAMLAGPAALTYRITGRDWSLAAETLHLGRFALRESIADLACFQVLYRDDGSVLCKVDYEIRNRSRQFLRLDLPAGARVLLARVNDTDRPITHVADVDDAYLLPLVRSKASVDGLVSFPVEIVLVYRTAALDERGGTLQLPLPRIDLPVAYAWGRSYLPDGMSVRRWSGPLARVPEYSSETATAHLAYGRGEMAEGYTAENRLTSPTAGRPQPRIAPGGEQGGSSAYLNAVLAKNYYRYGREAYEQGRYDDAARNLSKVSELAGGSVEASNAKRLLDNIKLARGGLTLSGEASKAAGRKVRAEQHSLRAQAEQQQAVHIEGARDALREGRWEQARAKLKLAEDLNRQLLAQGADQAEQDVRLREVQQARRTIEAALTGKTRQLRRQMEALQSKGDYAGALQAGKALREQLAGGADEGGKELAEVQKSLDDLAVQAAGQQAAEARGNRAIAEYARSVRIGGGEVSVLIDKALERAKAALGGAPDQSSFSRAGDELRHAQTALATARSVFTDDEYRQY
ncbi:MAG TPA: hypothetical protein VFJ30_00380, partial [Phycisphaerae bacterium]|nr:hypothetical protein [Phycisphaerae bacterium]